MQEVCVRYVVFGRVQRVFFRRFVLNESSKLNIKGYVKNLPTGEVEVVACGMPDSLILLEKVMNSGSKLARVDYINKNKISYCKYEDFTIIR